MRMTCHHGWLLGVVVLVLAVCQAAARADVQWAWVGAVSTEGALVRTGWEAQAKPGALRVSTHADLRDAVTIEPRSAEVEGIGVLARYAVQGLKPDTLYHYGWVDEAGDGAGRDATTAYGQFRSAPVGQASFSFVFASCATTGSNHPVFDEIRRHQPHFFLHTGDLHYEDIARNELALFLRAFQRVLTTPRQNAVFRAMPVIYIWDDHDYGPNDSDRNSPSREAAMQAYRTVVPHYPLALGDDPQLPVAQAFTYGRVRFILADLRSARDPKGQPDGPDKTMLGQAQRRWLKRELLNARDTHALTVFVSTVPWVSRSGTDTWAGFAHERQVLSDFIVANRITNLCIISGDAHMLGADDGTNNTFASKGDGPGFPVLQAAALDRRGSVKGGPYSHGTFPGPGQFGLLHIDDRGDRIDVRLEGRNHQGERLLELQFSREVRLNDKAPGQARDAEGGAAPSPSEP